MSSNLSTMALLALVLYACTTFPAETTVPSQAPGASSSARSVCGGSVASVGTNLSGAPADALEQLQGTYENDPGFMAAVFDGTKPVVVVQATELSAWQARLGPHGIAVAPSCVDGRLAAAVLAILPSLWRPDTAVSGGYNGLDDTIDVRGVDADTLISALDESDPAMGAAARAAVADGTLRVDPSHITTAR